MLRLCFLPKHLRWSYFRKMRAGSKNTLRTYSGKWTITRSPLTIQRTKILLIRTRNPSGRQRESSGHPSAPTPPFSLFFGIDGRNAGQNSSGCHENILTMAACFAASRPQSQDHGCPASRTMCKGQCGGCNLGAGKWSGSVR